MKISKTILAVAIILTIMTTNLGIILRIQDNGYGPIRYGFPAKFITYQYLPDIKDNLANRYTPKQITPLIWIKNIRLTWKSSSIELLGFVLNIFFYYAIVYLIERKMRW